MADYTMTINVDDHRAPGMQPLVDVVADFLENRCGCNQAEYTVIIEGPPELRLVGRHR